MKEIMTNAAMMQARGVKKHVISEKLDVSRETISRWQHDSEYISLINAEILDIRSAANGKIMGAYQDAVDTMQGLLLSENEAIRLQSAKFIIELLNR